MGGKKAGGGFLGVGGQSGFLNSGLFASGGANKIKGFELSPELVEAEREAIARQRAVASGQAPSVSQMALNQGLEQVGRQAQSLAASQRGASNPALAFRQAQMGQQQAGLDAAQQGAILSEQERRQADTFLANQAQGARTGAFNQAQLNQASAMNQQNMNAQFLGNLAGQAVALKTGGKKGAAYTGGVIPGDAKVEGDSPENDTETYDLSPGEIVIPRSAAKNKESAMKFLEAIKFENDKAKKNEKTEDGGMDVASMAKLFHEMTKLKGK